MKQKDKDDAGLIFFEEWDCNSEDLLKTHNKRFYIKKQNRAEKIKIRRKTKS